MAEQSYGDWADRWFCLAIVVALEARLPYMANRNPDGHSPKYWNKHPEARARAEAKSQSSIRQTIPVQRQTIDTAFFVAIVFGILTPLIALLQWNGVVTVGWKLSLFGYAVMTFIVVTAFWYWERASAWSYPKRYSWLFGTFMVLSVISATGVTKQYRHEHPLFVFPPTLKDRFKSDFEDKNGFKGGEYTVKYHDGETTTVPVDLIIDYPSDTKFLNVFIPMTSHPYDLCVAIANTYGDILSTIDSGAVVQTHHPGERTFSTKELKFSGRMFLYVDNLLTFREKADLEDYYKSKNLQLQIRDSDYVAAHTQH
jgi:hypothetical protein